MIVDYVTVNVLVAAFLCYIMLSQCYLFICDVFYMIRAFITDILVQNVLLCGHL